MRTTSHFTLRTEADAGLPTEQSTERETNGIPGPSQPSYATDTVMGIRKYFYEAQYDEVSGFLGLGSKPFEEWDDLYVPDVMLPTSAIKKLASRTLTDSEAAPELGGEAKISLFLSDTLQTLASLFRGYSPAPASSLSDGKIEGEVFCGDDLFLFVRVWAAAEFLDDLARVRYRQGQPHPRLACLCNSGNTYCVSDGSGFRRRIVKDLGTELVAKPPHTTLKNLNNHLLTAVPSLRVPHRLGTIHVDASHRPDNPQHHDGLEPWLSWLVILAHCSKERIKPNLTTMRKAGLLPSSSRKAWPPIDKHADNERQLPTESVPMVAPNQPLNDGPTATEASLQIQERRAQAVEAFWKGMDAEFRRTFKPYMLFKGESFTTLACFAADAKRYREILERRGSKFMVSVLVEKLEMSQKEGHWAVA
ncbi:hypothetical protein C8J57DRAFT_1251080 [Mycena rebaudengoi]|nr:hypothetical protein C8J57DRAFT_1251080 [Mycena rebaudengoi]